MIKDKNFIRCPECLELLISLHRHDYRTCSCGKDEQHGVMVDGGDDYFRIGWGAPPSCTTKPVVGFGKFNINYKTGKYKLLEIYNQKDLT